MSERTSYTPGTPCWVDLGAPDLDAAAEFYSGLLGWEVPEAENIENTGGYRRAMKDGADVAGVMPLMQEGQPPAWTTYISVTDADATVAAIGEHGGTIVAEPMDVMELGRMALFMDPTGAFCGIWQPGTFPGAQRVNEYGCLGWNELGTRDVEAAKQFYGAVFGWEVEERDMGEMGTYRVWKVGDDSVGGMLDISGVVPDEVPAYWLPYFWVEDESRALAKAEQSGGGIGFGPIDVPVGRFAMVNDPFGAMFAVIQPNEETLATAP